MSWLLGAKAPPHIPHLALHREGIFKVTIMVSTACPAPSIMTTEIDILSLASKTIPNHQPVWDGEGLPPAGCECEIKRVADWMPVTIKFISPHHTVFTTFGGTEDCYQTCSLQFRPIRSEADKKREEAVIAFSRVDPKVVPFEYGDKLSDGSLIGSAWYDLYDAIAAGKIPHIRIE